MPALTSGMHVGLVAQRGNERAAALASDIREALHDGACRVSVDESTASALGIEGVDVPTMADCGLVVSIGGDGTFLYAARGAAPAPILGINLGEVGFLNAVAPEDARAAVRETVDGLRAEEASIREVPRLVARGPDWELEPAINEVVIQGPNRGPAGGATVSITVDGSTYSATRADGVLVATPTGSTAYNLREDGPLVHPDLRAMVVTEMCPAEGMPSLVVDGDREIDVELAGADGGYVISDGRTQHAVEPPAAVSVSLSAEPLRIAGPRVDFFAALSKLS